MKPSILVAIFCLSLLPHELAAQSSSDKVSLKLGSVTVWLGMPKQEALSMFKMAGYRVLQAPRSTDNPDAGTVAVASSDGHSYNLEFDGDRLSYASRSWLGEHIDPLEAVIGALAAIVDQGSYGSMCSVSHEPMSEPDISAERIFISCGKRSVLIFKGKLVGHESVDVSEHIGKTR